MAHACMPVRTEGDIAWHALSMTLRAFLCGWVCNAPMSRNSHCKKQVLICVLVTVSHETPDMGHMSPEAACICAYVHLRSVRHMSFYAFETWGIRFNCSGGSFYVGSNLGSDFCPAWSAMREKHANQRQLGFIMFHHCLFPAILRLLFMQFLLHVVATA